MLQDRHKQVPSTRCQQNQRPSPGHAKLLASCTASLDTAPCETLGPRAAVGSRPAAQAGLGSGRGGCCRERKRVGSGMRVSVSVDIGGSSLNKKTKKRKT